MTKKILQISVMTTFLCLFALPASALFYYSNTAKTLGTWNGNNKILGFKAYINTSADGAWSRAMPQRVIKFTVQTPPRDIVNFIYPKLDRKYFARQMKQYWCKDRGDGNGGGVAPVPEPATLILLGSGLGGLLLYRRRQKQ